jgi:hypothetical protein
MDAKACLKLIQEINEILNETEKKKVEIKKKIKVFSKINK